MEFLRLTEAFSDFLDEQLPSILQDIATLVAIPSVYCENDSYPFGLHCKQALDAALAMGVREGFVCHNYDNFCGEICFGYGTESLAIAVHLDVVAAGDGWTYDPFELSIVEDFLVGRGTNDNKAPFVLCLYLLKFLKQQNIQLQHCIRLICGCDEESGMRDLQHFATYAEQPRFTLVPDAHFPLCYAEMGRITLMLSADWPAGALLSLQSDGGDETTPSTVRALVQGASEPQSLSWNGTSTSSASPDYSVSALHLALSELVAQVPADDAQHPLLELLTRLALPPAEQGLGLDCSDCYNGSLSCTLGYCQVYNQQLHATFSVRYPATANPSELFITLRSAVVAAGCKLQVKQHLRPTFIPPTHPVVTILEQTYQNLSGSQLKAYPAAGATYTRRLPLGVAYGMDSMEQPKPFGTGRGYCHQPDECQHLPSLLLGVKVYLQALLHLDSFDFDTLLPYTKDTTLPPTHF